FAVCVCSSDFSLISCCLVQQQKILLTPARKFTGMPKTTAVESNCWHQPCSWYGFRAETAMSQILIQDSSALIRKGLDPRLCVPLYVIVNVSPPEIGRAHV